ncbi:heterokaryon incompatibility protein-domain-containing protein [Leptodontidium sp. MPI-SDFR-AT-0119]|nr:heterokaryon incompatibility protein-domain-containing protein [Leptodontidium sp. MPI-SDFR-AT-0119]
MASSSSKPHHYGTQDGSLCRVCSEFTFDTLERGFELPLPKDLIAPGRDCRLCRFIISEWPRTIRALAQAPSTRLPRLILFLMSGEPDRSFSQDPHEKRLRALSVTNQISGLALVTDYNLREHKFNETGYNILGELAASGGDGDFIIAPNVTDITRRPILAADSEINFERAKDWLNACISQHPQCRKVYDAASRPLLPRRVISVGLEDTDTPRLLVCHGKAGRYMALSYCWGDASENPLVTTRSNIEDMQQAIPLASLPKTIQDAIKVTRRLGVEYLWVDSICILQDDSDDFQCESANMGKIYQHALLTIAATSARSSNEGLFKERYTDLEIRSNQTHFVRLPSRPSGENFGDIFLQTHGYPDHHILRPFDAELSNCEWSKRGWVVQERLLSRRILHYASEQLFWECQEGVFAESSDGALPESSLVHSKRSMFNRIVRETTFAAQATAPNHQLQTLRASAYLALDKISDAVGMARWSVEEARHRFWERVVQTYNVCNLTYERDKLPAILGLAQEIEVFTRQTYFGGVWLEDIARGLYWYGSDGNERLKKVEAAGAPSWSWTSWKGPLRMATYLAEYDTGRPRIAEDMLRRVQGNISHLHDPLKLYAHFWKAEIQDPSLPQQSSPRDQQWIVEDWWTPPSFVEDLYSSFPDWNCCELRGEALETSSSGVYGLVSFDSPDFCHYAGKTLICIILNTVRIKNLQSGISGYGYYQLVVGESMNIPGAYERLGVGISISVASDRIAHGWLGRKAPDTIIALV